MPSSSRSSHSTLKQNFEEDARQAAIDVEDLFESTSELRNDNLAAMVALFDPEEVILGDPMKCDDEFTIRKLTAISLRYERDPPFEYEMEDARDRFADRSHEPYFAVKSISPTCVQKDRLTAAVSGARLMLEVKILMNLEKHPHICQVYGLSASGPMAAFGSEHLEENFFLIIDAMSETLPDRIKAWKERKCYEGERFDDLASRQSRLTQRLEVALEISSAMTFLANRNLVYFLHPDKVGFDVRYKRIKLFQFGSVREGGSSPYFTFEEQDMRKRIYLAPEVFQDDKPVHCSADVFALGMLIWEILTLSRPLDGISKEAHIDDVVNGRMRPQLNRSWPDDLRSLMSDCWAASERPTMKQAYDRLEGCLLFQDFNGIDSTENHSRNIVGDASSFSTAAERNSRKLKYQRNAPQSITEEEGGDRDSKSAAKSKETVRSKASVSKDKDGSRSRDGLKSRRSTHDSSSSDARQRHHSSSLKSKLEKDQKYHTHEKTRQSDHKSVGDEYDRDRRSSRSNLRKSKSQSPTRSRSSHDGGNPPERRRLTTRDGGNTKPRRSRSRDINPHNEGDSKSTLLRRVKPGGEAPKLTRRKSHDPSLNRSFNGLGKGADDSERSRRSVEAENPEIGGNTTTYRRRRSPQRRDDGEDNKKGGHRRTRSKSSSGDQHARSYEANHDDSETSRSSRENPDGGPTIYRRRRSPQRGEENKKAGRRCRSKSSSGDQHARGHESFNGFSSSRKLNSSRDVAARGSERTSARGLGRTKSDDVGLFDKQDLKPLSRKLSRHKSSDGTKLYSPEQKSPGSLQRSPGSLQRSPGALQRSPGALQRSPGALQRSPGALQRSPGALKREASRRRMSRSKSGEIERSSTG